MKSKLFPQCKRIHLVSNTVKISLSQPCFDHFFGSYQHKPNKKRNKSKTKPTQTNQEQNKTQPKNSTVGDQLVSSWSLSEEMITLYHPWDWYGKINPRKM
jgi:hypothetical protein